MAAQPATREVRYLKTPALSRVLDPIDEGAVAAVSADRSLQAGSGNTNPIPYVRYSDRRIRELDIDFNCIYHGRFDKAGTFRTLADSFGEAAIQEMDLLLPEQFSQMAGDRADGPQSVKDQIRRLRFVVHLDHYPCRRDGEKNSFWAQVRDYMTDDERGWMEAASLDVSYFIPFEVFRDISAKKGRVGVDYRESIDKWKEQFGRTPDLVRDGFVLLFPDPDIRSSRVYRWGAEQKWILDRVVER